VRDAARVLRGLSGLDQGAGDRRGGAGDEAAGATADRGAEAAAVMAGRR
jgi:hypothetical protein